MGPNVLNVRTAYARLAWPMHILIGLARKLIFNNLTPLYVHGDLSIKKTYVTLCQFL